MYQYDETASTYAFVSENRIQELFGIRVMIYALRKAIWSVCRKEWSHDDVIKWKHFLRYWPFVRAIHRSPENSPHRGQWRGALMFSLISVWINAWVNNHEAGDLRRHRAHYDVTIMNIVRWIWSCMRMAHASISITGMGVTVTGNDKSCFRGLSRLATKYLRKLDR